MSEPKPAQEWTYSGLPLSSVRGGPTGKITSGSETIIHQIDKPTAERLIADHNSAPRIALIRSKK